MSSSFQEIGITWNSLFISKDTKVTFVIMLGISGHRGMRYGDNFEMITAWLNPGLSGEKPGKPNSLEMELCCLWAPSTGT